MSSLSVVNDSSVSRSDVLERTVPVVISTAQSLDFNTNGFSTGGGVVSSSGVLYYICGAATTMTFPVNYSRYKGRVVHISGNGGAVSVPASNVVSSGSVVDISGTSVNGSTLVSSGQWVSLICDGSTGWLVFATDSA